MGRAEWLSFRWTGRLPEGVHKLWNTYSPFGPLLRRAKPIIGGFIGALWIFKKPLTLPHARLMQRLEALGVPTYMQWGTYALYEPVLGKV